MPIELERLTLPFALRYLLPGITFVLINVVVPISLFRPQWFGSLSLSHVILISALSLVASFLMDALHVQKWSPWYAQSKTRFFSDLARTLGIRLDEADEAFHYAQGLVRVSGTHWSYIDFAHARWLMINHAGKSFLCLAAVMTCLSLYSLATGTTFPYFGDSRLGGLYYYGANTIISLFAVAVGAALEMRSCSERGRCNRNMLVFANSHREEIRAAVSGGARVQDDDALRFDSPAAFERTLARNGIDVSSWSTGAAKGLAELYSEAAAGESQFEKCRVLRKVSVVVLLIRCDNRVLIELEQELSDGRHRARDFPPSDKLLPQESIEQGAARCLQEELGITSRYRIMPSANQQQCIKESQSYPGLLTWYTFHFVEASVDELPSDDFWRANTTSSPADPVVKHRWGWRTKSFQEILAAACDGA